MDPYSSFFFTKVNTHGVPVMAVSSLTNNTKCLIQLWVPPHTCTLGIDILALTEEFTKTHLELRNTMIPAASLVGNLHLDATYNYSSVHFDFQ